MRFQKSQPAVAAKLVPPSASTGPLKNIDASSLAQERTRTKYTKSWQHFEHLRTVMARTGRYEEEALHKAGAGANRPQKR